MTWEWIFVAILGLMLLFLLVTYLVYLKVFHSDRKHSDNEYELPKGKQYQDNKEIMYKLIDEMKALKYEPISIISYDGTKISARYYHVNDDAPIQIQCPGYKGNTVRDFCGGTKIAREYGHNCLVIEQRGHGASDGKTISFGINEAKDLLEWINYVVNRFGKNTKIVLAGVSMGSATIILASKYGFVENVKCLIADCPYSSVKGIICKVCKDMKLPVKLVYPIIYCAAMIYGKFNMKDGDVVEAAKNINVPILLIHGKADSLISYQMSQDIYDVVNGEKQIELFDNAEHGISYIIDPDNYVKITSAFLRKYDL